MKRSFWKKLAIAGAALGIVAVLAVSGFVAWTRIARYAAFPEALEAASGSWKDGRLTFEPPIPSRRGFVFYPGGLVAPEAYALFARALAARGVLVIVTPMPLDLAFLGIGAADGAIASRPEISEWVVGGHSLGGAMAAQYAAGSPDRVSGIALFAAYPAEGLDLSGSLLRFASVYGTEDGKDESVFRASLERLPERTAVVEIEGGNHAQFGYYGPQSGDGAATMARERQQELAIEAALSLYSSGGD